MKPLKDIILLISLIVSVISLTIAVTTYRKYQRVEQHSVRQGFLVSLSYLTQKTNLLKEQYAFLREDYHPALDENEQEKLKEKIDDLRREALRLTELNESPWTIHERSIDEAIEENYQLTRIRLRIDASEEMYHNLKERLLRKYGTPKRNEFEPGGR